jgi:tetratricopeptide (TPR) repeat protein
MRRKAKKTFPFDIVSVEKLIEILFPSKNLERYIERNQLKTELGQDLIPRTQLILIHGLSGVGKTREAVEFIPRQNNIIGLNLKEENIYFSRGTVEVPIGLERRHPFRNIILLIDDLRVGLKVRDEIEEDKKKLEPVSERLKGAIDFFKKNCELKQVIVTMLTEEYEKLKWESIGSKLLKEFLVIELKKLPPAEKTIYIENLADTFSLAIEEPIKRGFVEASDESLTRLYSFFQYLQSQGKKCVEAKDVEEFKKISKILWNQIYNNFALEERLIFDVLTKLYQFSIPSLSYVVMELYIFIKRGFKPLARWRFKKAVKNLDGKWLRAEENDKVYCPEYRLLLKSAKDPDLHKDLQLVSEVIEKLSRKRKYEKDVYYLLMPLTRTLHDYKMYERSIKLNDRILELSPKALPVNTEKARSTVLFHKGHSYYCLGRNYWGLAEGCYKDSIQFYDQNLFAKHALATLYWKQANLSEALKYLDEIIKANEKDLLAYKTKLEILTDSGIDLSEAMKTYRDIKRLLRDKSIPSNVALSAEFACVRFSAKMGEFLEEAGKIRKAEKRFAKSIKQYETLINKIPSQEKELEAIVRNAYGCFFYDILNKPDNAIVQLEKACKAWSKHTHTLHKLASIYLEEAEIRIKERDSYVSKAKKLLNEALTIDQYHYPARLSVARLEGESINWDNVDKSKFWEEVSKIYLGYQKVMEPENDTYLSLHNSIAHHVAGCFLWHIEAVAHKRDILSNKLPLIPPADIEFSKSIAIEEHFKDTFPPRNIQDHLILAYYTLGSYKMTVALGSKDIFQSGQALCTKAFDLNKQTGSGFKFKSQNSHVESFVGKLLLSIGEKKKAKERLESAVLRYNKNWRAWWWLGRIHEIDKEFPDAMKCFQTASEGQASPALYGQLRSIVQDWIYKGKIIQEIGLKLRCSQRAYELDPNGDLNPKNLSDYGFDLYQKGKETGDQGTLEEAKKLLLHAYKKYIEVGLTEKANFPLWYAGECLELLNGQIDAQALKYYIESAVLEDPQLSYAKLKDKVLNYCYPIWKSGNVVDANIVSEIEDCANHHLEYPTANIMIGIVLQRNRENKRALPYLEKVRDINDTSVLRALMECYYGLGEKQKAEEICQELYPLLEDGEKRKLEDRSSKLGLKCF